MGTKFATASNLETDDESPAMQGSSDCRRRNSNPDTHIVIGALPLIFA
jgi:hypothetical protein